MQLLKAIQIALTALILNGCANTRASNPVETTNVKNISLLEYYSVYVLQLDVSPETSPAIMAELGYITVENKVKKRDMLTNDPVILSEDNYIVIKTRRSIDPDDVLVISQIGNDQGGWFPAWSAKYGICRSSEVFVIRNISQGLHKLGKLRINLVTGQYEYAESNLKIEEFLATDHPDLLNSELIPTKLELFEVDHNCNVTISI